jgi:hypothetical protein
MSDKWGWYEVVYNLASCKLENMDAITKIPAVECFTFMAYQQDKDGINKVKR